jgi:hypothetical protein
MTAMAARIAPASAQGGAAPARIKVSGQIYVNGNPPQSFSAQSVQVTLTPVNDSQTGIVLAAAKSDGALVFENVLPGAKYRLAVDVPGGFAMAGLYGGKEALAAPIEIKPDTPIQLMIGFEFGRVEGVVADRDQPFAGAMVVLVPAFRARTDLYKTMTSGPDGEFAFANVIPGSYKLFAWEAVKPNAWLDETFLKSFEDRGRLIRVEKSGPAQETIPLLH